MAKMHLIHQVVSISDFGSIAGKCSAADYHILTNIVVISDNQVTFFSCVVEILRFRSEDGILMYLISFSHFSTLQDTSVGHDDAVISDLYILFNVGKRQNSYILAQLCFGIYVS